ncbi:MAG TPA: efflux RND transporter periplasmic adaptor subunit [Anaeromyxobacter sp.]
MKPAERISSEPTPIGGRRGRTRRIVAVAVAVAVVIAAVVGWRLTRSAPPPTYETAKVDRGRLVAQVTATGTLSAIVTVQVGSQVSGRIAKLFVDFNSPVKKGQLIAKIDPELFRAALDQARANHLAAKGDLTRAKVQSADAKRQLERTRSLAERKLVAQADLDTSQANADASDAAVDAAAGRVEQAAAALRQSQVNLAYTDIVSPIDGTVISRNVDVGQTVAASLQAPIVFVIAEDLKKMQVDTSVAEADIGKLRDGMDATFTVDAYPGRRFRGVVRQIRNSPQTVQNVVTYDAVVDVDNSDLALRPGMTANASFVFAERNDALRVPNAALRFRPSPDLLKSRGGAGAPAPGAQGGAAGRRPGGDGGQDRKTVWVLRGTSPEPVHLKVGASDGSLSEVVEGDLREGDTVVTDASGGAGGGPTGGSRGGGGPPRIF